MRDFDDELLESHVALLERTADEVVDAEPRARLEIEVREQYRNMRRYIERVPHVTEAAAEAIRAEGIEPIREPIRGGTDGSMLSARGPADAEHLQRRPRVPLGRASGSRSRTWPPSAATIVRLAEIWARAPYSRGDRTRSLAAPREPDRARCLASLDGEITLASEATDPRDR